MSECSLSKGVGQDFPYIGLFMQATSTKYCYIVYEVVALFQLTFLYF